MKLSDKIAYLLGFVSILGTKDGIKTILAKRKKKGIIELSLDSIQHPVSLRAGTTDVFVFDHVFIKQEYNTDDIFEKRNITNPKVIIDCGANIGLTSIYFANKYPSAKILAIEPENANYELMQKNLSFYPKVECINAAIWNKTTQLSIQDANNLGNYAFSVSEDIAVQDNITQAITLDALIEANAITEIDILKIDIEGAEKELFESNFEKWLPMSKVIIIELHDRFKIGCGQAVFSAVLKYNYSIFTKDESIYLLRND